MGDRISVAFKNESRVSVSLFSHWGGMSFLQDVVDYVKRLIKQTGDKQYAPLDRREPEYAMVDFIRTYHPGTPQDSLYLGVDENDGDNSDNGHFIIDLNTGRYNE